MSAEISVMSNRTKKILFANPDCLLGSESQSYTSTNNEPLWFLSLSNARALVIVLSLSLSHAHLRRHTHTWRHRCTYACTNDSHIKSPLHILLELHPRARKTMHAYFPRINTFDTIKHLQAITVTTDVSSHHDRMVITMACIQVQDKQI